MKGFKITCLECGNEANVLKKENEFSARLDSETMEYESGYDGVFGIYCEKCGNELVGGWSD